MACRGTAAAALAEVQGILAELDLTLNEAKTRLVDLRRDAIRFLGFNIRVARSPRTGGTFPFVCPSSKALQPIRTTLQELTGRDRAPRPDALVIAEVNQVVRGWVGYFHYRNCSRAMASLRWYLEQRVRLFLGRKYGRWRRGAHTFPVAHLYGRLGLYAIPTTAGWTRSASASRCRGSDSRMRANGTSGWMRGRWWRGMLGLVKHRQTKGAGTARLVLHHGTSALLYPLNGYRVVCVPHV